MILCSQTNVWSYKTKNQGTNKLDIILLGPAMLKIIKHWNNHQFVIKRNCIDHGISYLLFHPEFIKRKIWLSYWLVVRHGTLKHCIWCFKMETFVSYLHFTFVTENRCKVNFFFNYHLKSDFLKYGCNKTPTETCIWTFWIFKVKT